MPRKKKYDKLVQFLVTNVFYDKLIRVCNKEDLEISQFVREAVMKEMNRRLPQ